MNGSPTLSASGFRQVRWRLLALWSDPAISTHCSDKTVRAGWHPEFCGDKRPLHHFPQLASEKKKLWAVAPPPICGQQIGKMRV
jgi:hypothetical protein